jgi:hypothetical protein
LNIVGEPACEASNSDAGIIIEELIRGIGEIEFFKCRTPKQEKDKMQAIAAFLDRDSADRAFAHLHETKVKKLGNSR